MGVSIVGRDSVARQYGKRRRATVFWTIKNFPVSVDICVVNKFGSVARGS
jgi:hypothetical protein